MLGCIFLLLLVNAPMTFLQGIQSNDCSNEGKTNAMFPYPGDLTKFYKCTNGQKIVKDCPNGMRFNPEFSTCLVQSQESTSPQLETECPDVDPENYTVMLPYPGDCTKFYLCDKGESLPKKCPGGLYFNANLSICDWPKDSGCTQLTTMGPSSGTTPAWTCPKPPADQPWRYMYPFPGNCSKFYMCSNGRAFAFDCPAGTWFNNDLCVCDWPSQSGCVQPSTPIPTTNEPPTPTATFQPTTWMPNSTTNEPPTPTATFQPTTWMPNSTTNEPPTPTATFQPTTWMPNSTTKEPPTPTATSEPITTGYSTTNETPPPSSTS